MKVLISRKTGNFYYHNAAGDFHCKEGFVTGDDLNSGKKVVNSNIGREFLVFDANKRDKLNKMKRGPQIILPKDLGYIAAKSGLDKDSRMVEAGGGSGGATIFFSQIAKDVKTYEIREDNCKIIRKNLDFMEVDNVELINKDIKEEIVNEKDLDLLFLDMPDSWEVLKHEKIPVKSGKYIVCYVPSITQIQEITNVLSGREDLYLEEISEVILRHWRVWGKVARPEHRKETDHTAFLVFIRNI